MNAERHCGCSSRRARSTSPTAFPACPTCSSASATGLGRAAARSNGPRGRSSKRWLAGPRIRRPPSSCHLRRGYAVRARFRKFGAARLPSGLYTRSPYSPRVSRTLAKRKLRLSDSESAKRDSAFQVGRCAPRYLRHQINPLSSVAVREYERLRPRSRHGARTRPQQAFFNPEPKFGSRELPRDRERRVISE